MCSHFWLSVKKFNWVTITRKGEFYYFFLKNGSLLGFPQSGNIASLIKTESSFFDCFAKTRLSLIPVVLIFFTGDELLCRLPSRDREQDNRAVESWPCSSPQRDSSCHAGPVRATWYRSGSPQLLWLHKRKFQEEWKGDALGTGPISPKGFIISENVKEYWRPH